MSEPKGPYARTCASDLTLRYIYAPSGLREFKDEVAAQEEVDELNAAWLAGFAAGRKDNEKENTTITANNAPVPPDSPPLRNAIRDLERRLAALKASKPAEAEKPTATGWWTPFKLAELSTEAKPTVTSIPSVDEMWAMFKEASCHPDRGGMGSLEPPTPLDRGAGTFWNGIQAIHALIASRVVEVPQAGIELDEEELTELIKDAIANDETNEWHTAAARAAIEWFRGKMKT